MELIERESLKDITVMESPIFGLLMKFENGRSDIEETTNAIINSVEEDIREEIRKAPTVDAELVRHGHWNGIEMDSRGYTDIFECSECKCYVRTPFMMKVMEYDFCPSCGAKMDAQEKENE